MKSVSVTDFDYLLQVRLSLSTRLAKNCKVVKTIFSGVLRKGSFDHISFKKDIMYYIPLEYGQTNYVP